MPSPSGRVAFHGEFSSADASGLSEPNSRILLYPAGSTTAYTLASGDKVVVQSFNASTATALTVTVYDGSDNSVAAGESIFTAVVAASSNEVGATNLSHSCQAGTWPKVKTSASGQIYAYIAGYIQVAAT